MTGTERLWLTEPRRKTALAKVIDVRGDRFRLDRSLFCPKSRRYRHPQPADRGTVWTPDGEKRRLVTVFEDDAGLWHRLRGTVPRVGETLQCHLDVDRRAVTARAHTAMHLALHTLPRTFGPLAEDPEVRGGGHLRLTFATAWIDPKSLSTWRTAILDLVQRDLPLERTHVVDTALSHALTPQPLPDEPYPGPPTTREAIVVHSVGGYPCDGTHVERTAQVGQVVVREAHPAQGGHFVVVLQAR